MPFNGAGLFVRVRSWVADATAGIKIRADFHDTEDDNFAAGISQCIARDGQSAIIANIPFNSKRIVSLADPNDPQDASTKAYADTKVPIAGGTVTGALTVNGGLTANSWIMSRGYRCRQGLDGGYGGNWFNFNWNGSTFEMWADNYHFGEAATTAYVEQRASDWAHAVADPKVNRSGDTMTGYLAVNGELIAVAGYIRFNNSGSGGYVQWNGGGTYTFGSGGTAWHSGNLRPITDGRLTNAGTSGFPGNGVATEPYAGAVATGFASTLINNPATIAKYRYMQLNTPGGWFTVGYNG